MLLLSMLTWHWPGKQLRLPFELHGHQAYFSMSAPSTRNTSQSFSPGMVSSQIGCLETLMNIMTVSSNSLWFPRLNHKLHTVLMFLWMVCFSPASSNSLHMKKIPPTALSTFPTFLIMLSKMFISENPLEMFGF